MAAATNESKLADLLTRATNLFGTTSTGSSSIDEFCVLVKSEPEGPQITLRLLAHKLQSPTESEAMAALDVLQRCVETCGPPFHAEIGKFRFLNEIVKVISPKYFGVYTSQRVKDRCIEMMYSWSKTLKSEPKIGEAFEMLRKQGLLRVDPAAKELEAEAAKKAAETERQRVSAASAGSTLGLPEMPKKKTEMRKPILDEDRAKTLKLLLASKRPEDLQAANQLIKESLKQDEERVERHTKRHTELEIVRNNMTLLTDMLDHYEESITQRSASDDGSGKSPKNSSSESTGDADLDVMAELYMMLDKHRPALFRMASEVEETEDDMLAALLRANDELLEVLARYRHLVNGEPVIMAPPTPRQTLKPQKPQPKPTQSQPSYLVDVADILGPPKDSTHGSTANSSHSNSNAMSDFLSQELAAVGISPSAAPHPAASKSAEEAKTAFKEFSTTPSGLDQELISLEGLTSATGGLPNSSSSSSTAAVQKILDTLSAPQTPSLMPNEPVGPHRRGGPSAKQPDALDLLGQEIIQKHLPGGAEKEKEKLREKENSAKTTSTSNASDNKVNKDPNQSTCILDSDDNPFVVENDPKSTSTPAAESKSAAVGNGIGKTSKHTTDANSEAPNLSDMAFSLDRFRPLSAFSPLALYQRNGMNVLLLLHAESPHPSVKVFLVSSTSMAADPITSFKMSFSVHAKQVNICQLKVLDASATSLAPFNPIMAPAVVTQLILATFSPTTNPSAYPESLKLRFELSYRMRDTCYSESGIEEVPLFFDAAAE